jgi:hypothetical protein
MSKPSSTPTEDTPPATPTEDTPPLFEVQLVQFPNPNSNPNPNPNPIPILAQQEGQPQSGYETPTDDDAHTWPVCRTGHVWAPKRPLKSKEKRKRKRNGNNLFKNKIFKHNGNPPGGAGGAGGMFA